MILVNATVKQGNWRPLEDDPQRRVQLELKVVANVTADELAEAGELTGELLRVNIESAQKRLPGMGHDVQTRLIDPNTGEVITEG